MQARDRSGRVLLVSSREPGVEARYGLSRAELDREAWAIEAGGRRRAGAAAINTVLAELGWPWRAVALALSLPPLWWLERLAYRWFAAHRHWFARFASDA